MHVQPRAMPLYREYVAHLNRLPVPVAFAAHTGDLVVDSLRAAPKEAAALFDLYEEATSDLQPPRRNVIGNHEHVALGREDYQDNANRGTGMYRRRFGPTSYAFRYGPYHFVALDGTTIDSTARMGYRDGLNDQSAAWAVEYLKSVQGGELPGAVRRDIRFAANRPLPSRAMRLSALLSLFSHAFGSFPI